MSITISNYLFRTFSFVYLSVFLAKVSGSLWQRSAGKVEIWRRLQKLRTQCKLGLLRRWPRGTLNAMRR